METTGILHRLDELEQRFTAKMDLLADAMTRLAVQQQLTAENSRRLGKLEGDMDEAFKLIRVEKDRREVPGLSAMAHSFGCVIVNTSDGHVWIHATAAGCTRGLV